MPGRTWVAAALIFCTTLSTQAQKIVYSKPEKDDTQRLNWEIAGKIGVNFLIYKNIRGKSWITVLDKDMLQVASVEQEYVPDNDRMINTEFFAYGDFCYMFYQYQRKNIVYCMASKIDGNGQKVGEVIQVDTTHIGFSADNKIYTVLSSEDKKRLIVFKINSKNKQNYIMTSILMDDRLNELHRSRIRIQMDERNDYIDEFHLDNDGDLIFTHFSRHNNDNISSAAFMIKKANADTLISKTLNIDKNWLDEIHIKIDNFNKRYFLTSFYFRERKGNIDGLYFYVWDKVNERTHIEDTTMFSEELKREAKGESTTRTAFNVYFIRQVVTRRDGGFVIGAEAYYTSSRFNTWNRWDYLYGSPYMYSYNNSNYYSPNNYSYGSRYYGNQSVRYHAENITIAAFNNTGKLEWYSVMPKNQYDDESDDLLSYQLMITGGQVHFLFNQQERKNNLLSDYSLTPDGVLTHNPTLKNLDKGYEFMPKHAKQVSSKEMIIPCIYRNYICFAKIEFN